jgi:hypothetical protein
MHGVQVQRSLTATRTIQHSHSYFTTTEYTVKPGCSQEISASRAEVLVNGQPVTVLEKTPTDTADTVKPFIVADIRGTVHVLTAQGPAGDECWHAKYPATAKAYSDMRDTAAEGAWMAGDTSLRHAAANHLANICAEDPNALRRLKVILNKAKGEDGQLLYKPEDFEVNATLEQLEKAMADNPLAFQVLVDHVDPAGVLQRVSGTMMATHHNPRPQPVRHQYN